MSTFAAVDVGSNSIRLLVSEADADGRLRPVHTDREVVRLGTGVYRDGRLSQPSMDLAYYVLERMAATHERWGVSRVRAVGTSALRDASNRSEFVLKASSILGTPLEVIGGHEEARLVQQGVIGRLPNPDERLLIVDVGGGSVQLIVSEGGQLRTAVSLPLGAVRLTEMFGHAAPPTAVGLLRMRHWIRERLAGSLDELASARVTRFVATSATAGAIVSAVNNVQRSRRLQADGLTATAEQVAHLLTVLVGRDVEGRASIPGIGRRRAEVVVAGVAVLDEVLFGLRLPVLQYSTAGVREGIVADLVSGDWPHTIQAIQAVVH